MRLHLHLRHLRPHVTALATVLTLSACGGGGSSGSGSSDQSVEEQLGFDQAGIQAKQLSVEEHIRDCMKAQGFEYVPIDPTAQQAALVGTSDLSDEEFVKQYGYGISTLYEKRTQQVGDPNAAIRDQLATSDLAAYDRALRGENTDATLFSAMDTGDFSNLGGCTKQATDEAFGGAETLRTMQEKLEELDQQTVNDSRMVAAVQTWSDCMRQAGYSFGTNPDDIDLYFQDKLDALVGTSGGTSSVGGAPLTTAPANGETAPAYDPAALESLQQEEIATANADLACEEKHIISVEDKVRAEYEKAFREQNGDLLKQAGTK